MQDLALHTASLRALSDSGVFAIIHARLVAALPKRHKAYLVSKPDYQLLSSTAGNLFHDNREDYAFVVYDKRNARVSILLYDSLENFYKELYRDIKVWNALKEADCDYGSFGTLDYQLAEELIYQRDYLIKKRESFLKHSTCKIVDITQDPDLVLEEGCFAKDFSAKEQLTSLCIPTSVPYNNWECLTYDRPTRAFVIFYGQTFAD
jgi:hypothetical protein